MISESEPLPGNGEIRSFTGLRGCAAVMVMFYHFTLNMPDPPPGYAALQRLLQNGYLWVDLFFILSGFVMAHSQAVTFARPRTFRTHLKFLLSRLARVYPLYLIILLESASSYLWRAPNTNPASFAWTFVLNLFMVQAWGLAPSLEGAAWSISTEWAAYLLFPLLLGATILSSRRTAWIVGLISVITIMFLAFSPEPLHFPDQNRGGPLDIYSSATTAPVFRCLAEFNLGLLAYRIARHVTSRPHQFAGLFSAATMAAILAAMCFPGLDVAIVLLFVVLLVSLAPQNGLLARALSSRIPYTLGLWSYSIYLIHDKFSHPAGSIERAFEDHMPAAPVVASLLAACVVIACSAATFLLIEKPMRDHVKKRVQRLSLFLAPVSPQPARVPSETAPAFETLAERLSRSG